MKKRGSIKAVLAIGLAAFVMGADKAPQSPGAAPDAEGFVSLFDGSTLNGWKGLEGFWSVKDGAITGAEDKQHAAPQTFLIYDKPVANFELHYKYKFATPDGNSGVQFRSQVYKADTFAVGGYQADCDGKRGYDGSIYDEHGIAGGRGTMSKRGDITIWTAAPKPEVKPLPQSNKELQAFVKQGDWNDVVLVADGNHVTYTINGHLMTDLTDNSPKALKEGVLALQLHHGFVMEIQFKDLKLKTLPAK
ncbi:MAG TPA: DUF1080 domain-containing protein [Tepidisphaeraceae bacterium]|nr:DUF1080 domain-containing protein [Tepidisphaeraceae bacterium]